MFYLNRHKRKPHVFKKNQQRENNNKTKILIIFQEI